MCAHNEEAHVGAALESLISQVIPEPFIIREVLVVASGCTDETEEIVREWSRRDARVVLLSEPIRSGKAQALNWLLRDAKGEIIVSLNADARLMPGALAALLEPFSNKDVFISCGAPVLPDISGTVLLAFIDLQWRLHNRTLGTLWRLGVANHCCDEFMAMRRGFVSSLPEDLMNDGAYLGTYAGLRGISVVFCPEAKVIVDPPKTIRAYITRRNALLRGHRQVREMLKRPSNTLETLATENPALAFEIIAGEMFSSIKSTLAGVLVLLPLEGVASLIALIRHSQGKKYDPLWTMVD